MIVDRLGQYFGNYCLVRLLGTGGQASVYLGEHRYLKRSAAIKILRASLSDQSAERFLEEAQLLVDLSHPHIVRVHEFAIEQGTPFLVMEYAPGGSLRSLYPAGSCLFPHEVVASLKQVASALQYAHDHHIIHCDIKPENFLLNEQQEILLSDFGIALFAPSPELLSTQEMIGTIPYMAPEQLRGKPCFASDQYALGIIAYEWLCGCRPFQGSAVEIMAQHLYSSPPHLREQRPFLPQALEDVIFKALAKLPEQRYENVAAFIQAMEHASQQVHVDQKKDSHVTLEHITPVSPSTPIPVFSDHRPGQIPSTSSSRPTIVSVSTELGSETDTPATVPAHSGISSQSRLSRRTIMIGLALSAVSVTVGGVLWQTRLKGGQTSPIYYSFEDGIEGWLHQGNILSVQSSSDYAKQGSHSLKVVFRSRDARDKPFIEVAPSSAEPLSSGQTVSMYVYVPTTSPKISVSPFIIEGSGWNWVTSPQAVTIAPRTWTKITYTVPAGVVSAMRVGLQFVSDPVNVESTIYVDAVGWS